MISNRFAYAGKVTAAPYRALSAEEFAQATQLPNNTTRV